MDSVCEVKACGFGGALAAAAGFRADENMHMAVFLIFLCLFNPPCPAAHALQHSSRPAAGQGVRSTTFFPRPVVVSRGPVLRIHCSGSCPSPICLAARPLTALGTAAMRGRAKTTVPPLQQADFDALPDSVQ